MREEVEAEPGARMELAPLLGGGPGLPPRRVSGVCGVGPPPPPPRALPRSAAEVDEAALVEGSAWVSYAETAAQ